MRRKQTYKDAEPFWRGVIKGESRDKNCWVVKRDAYASVATYHKDYCQREPLPVSNSETKMIEYSVYEIWQDGTRVASCCGPDEVARKEAEHYAMMYGQDGPVEMKKRRQRKVAAVSPS